MKKVEYVALSVGPLGMCGARAVFGRKNSVEIEDWAERGWESAPDRDLSESPADRDLSESPATRELSESSTTRDLSESPATRDLSGRIPEIRRFVQDLAGGRRSHLRGMFSVHPSWVLVRKVAVPPAGKKETHQYLQLQVERQQTILRNGEIAWSSLETPARPAAPGREALLLMCKQETVRPLEEAFRSCGISVSFGTVSSLSDFALLRRYPGFSERNDAVIARVEKSGASLLEIRNRRIADFSWIPFDVETEDPQTRFSLPALKFAEQMEGRENAKIVLWGEAELRAQVREHLSGPRDVEEFEPRSLPSGVFLGAGARKPAKDEFPLDVIGLLIQRASSSGAGVNLIQSGPSIPVWAERFGVLFKKKVAIPLAAALFLLLMLVSAGTARLESGLYAEMVGASARIASGVRAAERNNLVLERYGKERRPMLDILLEVTKALPEGVLVSNLKITNKGEVQITGNCPSLSIAEQIVGNLNKSALLTKASTERMGKGKGGMTFTIKCSLKKRGGS